MESAKKMLCMPKDCCILKILYFLQDNKQLTSIKTLRFSMYKSKAKLFHVAKFYSTVCNCHHVYLRAVDLHDSFGCG